MIALQSFIGENGNLKLLLFANKIINMEAGEGREGVGREFRVYSFCTLFSPINITRTIRQTVGRITNEILGMKELKFTHSLPIPLQPAVTHHPYPAGLSTYLNPLSPFPSLQK